MDTYWCKTSPAGPIHPQTCLKISLKLYNLAYCPKKSERMNLSRDFFGNKELPVNSPLGGPKKNIFGRKNSIMTSLRHDVSPMHPPCMVRVRTQSSQKHGHSSLKSSLLDEKRNYDVITSRRHNFARRGTFLGIIYGQMSGKLGCTTDP